MEERGGGYLVYIVVSTVDRSRSHYIYRYYHHMWCTRLGSGGHTIY